MRQDNWHEHPAAILRFFAAMANYMEASQLEGFLMHILSPMYRITEDDTIRDQGMGEYLQTLSVNTFIHVRQTSSRRLLWSSKTLSSRKSARQSSLSRTTRYDR